jgi:hypothetical protein
LVKGIMADDPREVTTAFAILLCGLALLFGALLLGTVA